MYYGKFQSFYLKLLCRKNPREIPSRIRAWITSLWKNKSDGKGQRDCTFFRVQKFKLSSRMRYNAHAVKFWRFGGQSGSAGKSQNTAARISGPARCYKYQRALVCSYSFSTLRLFPFFPIPPACSSASSSHFASTSAVLIGQRQYDSSCVVYVRFFVYVCVLYRDTRASTHTHKRAHRSLIPLHAPRFACIHLRRDWYVNLCHVDPAARK